MTDSLSAKTSGGGAFGVSNNYDEQTAVPLASLLMANNRPGVSRDLPIKTELAQALQRTVARVYGPDYKILVMEGAQPPGPRGTPGTYGSRRHGTGVAADIIIHAPDGHALSDNELVPLSQEWLASGNGSVGFPADSHYLHLDLIGGSGPGALPLESGKEGKVWFYGTPTTKQRDALTRALNGEFPTLGTPQEAASAASSAAAPIPKAISPDLQLGGQGSVSTRGSSNMTAAMDSLRESLGSSSNSRPSVADLYGGIEPRAYNHVTDAQRTAMDALPPPPVNWSMGHPSSAGLTGPQVDPSNAGYGSTSSGAGAGSFSAPNETTWEMMSDPVAAPGRFSQTPSLPSDHFVPFSVNSSRAQSVSTGGYQSQPMPGAQGGDASTTAGTPLGAIDSLVSGLAGPAPSAALGYAGDASGGLGYGSPVMDTYRGAPAGGVSQPGYGDPRLQQGHYYGRGPVNAPPLSPFESAMTGVRSSVIPKYIAVTHHVPNPDYVAQFGPIEPPMPDFVGMLASRLSRDRNANAGPTFAQAPGDFGASPVGQWGDYLLDKTPPPLPPAPPRPIIEDPEAIRAILEPALQALQNQRAAAAMQAGQPAYGADNGGLVPTTTTDGQARRSLWDDANGVGGSLASRG